MDGFEVLEDFAVGRSVNIWAVEGRDWLVVNIHELSKHWEGCVAEKEGRRGRWIAWWAVGVGGIAHGCWPSWGVKASVKESLSLLVTRCRVQTRASCGWPSRGGEGRGQEVGSWHRMHCSLSCHSAVVTQKGQ